MSLLKAETTFTLLEFVAEHPVRHGTLPGNIVAVAEAILDAGAERSAMNETLELVCSGCVPRERRVQLPLIDLLCDRGADPNRAIQTAFAHGEFEAAHALIRRGARVDLPVAAALGHIELILELLPSAGDDDRHRASALASQFGHVEIVRSLLDAGQDPNRYNPVGFHSHSTPMHQAAVAGHDKLVRLLVERGARVDMKDIIWQSTPAGWAKHAGKTELETYLRTLETQREKMG
jgi:ankyrin repeat protein